MTGVGKCDIRYTESKRDMPSGRAMPARWRGGRAMKGDRIGLGVIGMNPHNMGSTMTLVRDTPDLRFNLVAACAKRGDVLAE